MVTRAVLHGVDTSVPALVNLPAVPNQASRCYTDDLRGDWIYDETDAKWWPNGRISFEYDFDVDGGDIGDITLGEFCPANFIVTHGVIETVEDLDSEGAATVALKLEAAEDVLAALGYASFISLVAVVPDGQTASKFVKPTANRYLTMTIATAALTAGKFVVHLFGFPGQAGAEESSASSSSSSSSVTSSSSSSSATSSSSSSATSSSSSSNSSSQSSSSSSSSVTSSSSSATSSSSSSSQG